MSQHMNQQEIDRLWESHSDGPLYDISHTKKQPAFRYMRKHDFTAALQEATAQSRREGVVQVAQLFEDKAIRNDDAAERFRSLCDYNTADEYFQYASEDRAIANAIRALAAQEGGE